MSVDRWALSPIDIVGGEFQHRHAVLPVMKSATIWGLTQNFLALAAWLPNKKLLSNPDNW